MYESIILLETASLQVCEGFASYKITKDKHWSTELILKDAIHS